MSEVSLQVLVDECKAFFDMSAPDKEALIFRCVAYLREFHSIHVDDFYKAAHAINVSSETIGTSMLAYLQTLIDMGER